MPLLHHLAAGGRPLLGRGNRLLQHRCSVSVAAAASTLQPCSIDSAQQDLIVRRTIVEQLQERLLNSGLRYGGNGNWTETGNGLDFFQDADVHQNELEALWSKEWIFAGHDCELPKAGSYLALQIGAFPVVIVRARDKSIRAFHNICRHRGFKICDDGNGVVMRRLMCPYHRWTYDLDGNLAFARDFGSKEDGFDKANYSLKPVALQVADGHLFVCVADAPKPFEFRDQLESTYLAPFDLKRSKVAYQSRRILQRNWKTVWKSTPEEGHGAVAPADGGMTIIAPDRQYRLVNLTKPGSMSEKEAVMDHIIWHHYPNIWGNFKADHVVTCRLLPISATQTELVTKWVVPGNAEVGRDYSLQELTGVERAEDLQGDVVEYVHSSPVLQGKEAACQFVDWYFESMVRALRAKVSIAA